MIDKRRMAGRCVSYAKRDGRLGHPQAAVPHVDYPRSGECPAVLLRTAAYRLFRRSVGLARASASIPRPGHDPHQVRRRKRCESDQVADRPFTLHPEALHRSGRRDATASFSPGRVAPGSPPA